MLAGFWGSKEASQIPCPINVERADWDKKIHIEKVLRKTSFAMSPIHWKGRGLKDSHSQDVYS